jgi:hypothetical protein
MLMLSLITAFLTLLLLEGQSIIFPSQAKALNCCPCWNPCMKGCQCRGPGTHCPSCRGDSSDILRGHAVSVNLVIDVRTSRDLSSFARYTISPPHHFVETGTESEREVRRTTLRFLGDQSLRFKPWCPEFS